MSFYDLSVLEHLRGAAVKLDIRLHVEEEIPLLIYHKHHVKNLIILFLNPSFLCMQTLF